MIWINLPWKWKKMPLKHIFLTKCQSEHLRCRQSDVRGCQCQCQPQSVSLLTFLLPSVTVRGTGVWGHLLRLGGGFSLFHRMMICNKKKNKFALVRIICWIGGGDSRCSHKVVVIHLWTVLGLGDDLQQLHDWLRLEDQWRNGMYNSSELLTWTHSWKALG